MNPPKLEATTFVQPEHMDVTTFSQVPAAVSLNFTIFTPFFDREHVTPRS